MAAMRTHAEDVELTPTGVDANDTNNQHSIFQSPGFARPRRVPLYAARRILMRLGLDGKVLTWEEVQSILDMSKQALDAKSTAIEVGNYTTDGYIYDLFYSRICCAASVCASRCLITVNPVPHRNCTSTSPEHRSSSCVNRRRMQKSYRKRKHWKQIPGGSGSTYKGYCKRRGHSKKKLSA